MNTPANWPTLTFYQKAAWMVNTGQCATFGDACRELQRRGVVVRAARRKAALKKL